VNRSLIMALCSPHTAFSRYCTAFVFLASDVINVTVEEKRDVVNWAFVFLANDVSGILEIKLQLV